MPCVDASPSAATNDLDEVVLFIKGQRAEVSHQPTRQRERQMRRFKSPGHAQRFLSAHGPINNTFRCQRHRLPAVQYRCVRTAAFSLWNEVSGVENIQ